MAAIIINFVVLITLGFFAKDNLLAELKPLLSPETSHNNATLPSMRSIEVAFSPKGGATATIGFLFDYLADFYVVNIIITIETEL